MSPPRTKVRRVTWPGEEPSPIHGYLAPPDHRARGFVDEPINEAGNPEPVYSYTPPSSDHLLIWWPGGRWTWELSSFIEPVPPDPAAEHPPNT
ncbi:hypothetical protein [Nocardia tengchongensis]|uniref:hypothetical protein n=1 Tax=Nocardia tengchongensis TaxID=2055889 RepID=UPI003617EC02